MLAALALPNVRPKRLAKAIFTSSIRKNALTAETALKFVLSPLRYRNNPLTNSFDLPVREVFFYGFRFALNIKEKTILANKKKELQSFFLRTVDNVDKSDIFLSQAEFARILKKSYPSPSAFFNGINRLSGSASVFIYLNESIHCCPRVITCGLPDRFFISYRPEKRN